MVSKCRVIKDIRKEDKLNFISNYDSWKREQFKSKSLFSTTTVEEQTAYGSRPHHPCLSLPEITIAIFDKLDKADKKSMAVVCKAWTSLFLVGTETSKVDVDYERQLVKENVNCTIRVTRDYRTVAMYCSCAYARSKREAKRIHRKIRRNQEFAILETLLADRLSEESGSEGYYDPDC